MINEQQLNKDNTTGRNHEGVNPNRSAHYLTASSVIGDKVLNSAGEHLGTIKDVMLDMRTGKVEYVVLEFGGFMGMGEKLFAIPFSAMKLEAVKQSFVLHQDKKFIQKAPGFDKKHWPETDEHFLGASEYWGGFMGVNTGGSVG